MAKDNFCIYCGFKLFPDDHFCPNCGAKLDDVVKVKKTTAPKDTPKNTYSSSTSTNKTATIKQDYTIFKNRVRSLRETYETKEAKVMELLEKKFPAGQISYYRFKDEVDNCRVSFFKEADSAQSMIDLSDEYSDKIASELKNKIKTLESIIGKLNDLQSELIISISNADDDGDEEIKNLIDEMNDLIDSVKDYEWFIITFFTFFEN